jgi:protein gp37
MSDLFHDEVPTSYIGQVFNVMKRAHWHQFQVLTKRSGRLLELNQVLDWQPHIWMGVSVESEDYLFRVDYLRRTSAAVKFLSLEPLLGPLHNLVLDGIDWVIAGGESGPHARPVDPLWVREIRDRCQSAQVAFFFKQWGGVFKSRTGRRLDGREWDEMPTAAR